MIVSKQQENIYEGDNRQESCSWTRKLGIETNPMSLVSTRQEINIKSNQSVETMLEKQERSNVQCIVSVAGDEPIIEIEVVIKVGDSPQKIHCFQKLEPVDMTAKAEKQESRRISHLPNPFVEIYKDAKGALCMLGLFLGLMSQAQYGITICWDYEERLDNLIQGQFSLGLTQGTSIPIQNSGGFPHNFITHVLVDQIVSWFCCQA